MSSRRDLARQPPAPTHFELPGRVLALPTTPERSASALGRGAVTCKPEWDGVGRAACTGAREQSMSKWSNIPGGAAPGLRDAAPRLRFDGACGLTPAIARRPRRSDAWPRFGRQANSPSFSAGGPTGLESIRGLNFERRFQAGRGVPPANGRTTNNLGETEMNEALIRAGRHRRPWCNRDTHARAGAGASADVNSITADNSYP